jgi:hypothetical protein
MRLSRRLAPAALAALFAGALVGADAGSGASAANPRPARAVAVKRVERAVAAPRLARAQRVARAVPAERVARAQRLVRAVPAPRVAYAARLRAVPARRLLLAPTPLAAAPLAAYPAPAPFAVVRPGRLGRVMRLAAHCRPASTTAPAAPSQMLLQTFGILRRPATAADALPAEAQAALKARGLKVEGTGMARLLRTGPGDGKAWVVPVADVGGFLVCGGKRPADREGLAVVATGDAPVGGGGSRDDLVRGRAPVSVESCAGPDKAISVSGIVPDGVSAVYLTATDGTAVRADVRDNGFSLLVPAPRLPDQRFLVWTGSGGTPHVQPVGVGSLPTRLCGRIKTPSARVSPGPLSCVPSAPLFNVAPRPVRPVRARVRRRHPLRLVVPSPPVLLETPGAGCLAGG